jgi:phosphatidylglycerol---prolipoprotein diacylglyceryl transferase
MIIHWNTDPEIFRVGWLSLRYYSVLFAGGVLGAYYVIGQVYKRERMDISALNSMTFYLIAGLLIGARLGHCLFYDFSYYSKHVIEIFLPISIQNGKISITGYQGLASHGGVIGVLVALGIWKLRNKAKDILSTLDAIAIGAPVAAILIRIGNFINSEIIGNPTGGDYGIIFSRVDSIPRHPGQLYEAFAYMLIFIIMVTVYRRTKAIYSKGKMLGLLLILAFSARIIIEFFKENQSPFESHLLLNMGQILSIPFIIAGIILLLRGCYSKKVKAG